VSRYVERDRSLKWATVAAADVLRETYRLSRRQDCSLATTITLLRVLVDEPTTKRFLAAVWSLGVDMLRRECESKLAGLAKCRPLAPAAKVVVHESLLRNISFAKGLRTLVAPIDLLAATMMDNQDGCPLPVTVFKFHLPKQISYSLFEPFRLPSNCVRVVTRRRESRPAA